MRQRKHILATALLGLGLLAQSGASFAKPVVVELFTSQGCSSCPPADEVLGRLAQQEDVIALSLPVTYWDYLGWKDTLADPAFTQRQRRYAQQMHLRQVYTPQMIIDGRVNVVGSHADEVADVITARQSTPAGPAITLTHQGDDMKIAINASGLKADVFVLPVNSLVAVAVGRGENSGHTLNYHNVVRAVRPIGQYDGTAFTKTLPMVSMWMKDADRCAVLLQDPQSGAIVSAALLDLTSP